MSRLPADPADRPPDWLLRYSNTILQFDSIARMRLQVRVHIARLFQVLSQRDFFRLFYYHWRLVFRFWHQAGRCL